MIFRWSERGTILMVTGAAVFALSWFWIAVMLTWQASLPSELTAPPTLLDTILRGGLAMLAGGILWILGCRRRPPHPAENEIQASHRAYANHLVGLGYAFVLLGMFNALILGGLFHTGRLGLSGDEYLPSAAGDVPPPTDLPERLAVLVLVSLGMSMLGTLFFVQTSLRKSRDAGHRFDDALFWTGLWFRCGEAIAFSLTFLWLAWSLQPSLFHWMPALSLLLGMFVITGEQIMVGLAARLLALAGKMLSTPEGSSADAEQGSQRPTLGAPAQGVRLETPPATPTVPQPIAVEPPVAATPVEEPPPAPAEPPPPPAPAASEPRPPRDPSPPAPGPEAPSADDRRHGDQKEKKEKKHRKRKGKDKKKRDKHKRSSGKHD